MPVRKVFLTVDKGRSTPNIFFVKQLLESYEGRGLDIEEIMAVDAAVILPSEKSEEGVWYIQAFSHHGVDREFEVLGHTSDESQLPEKTYSCARRYAEKLAAQHSIEFVDRTPRASQSALEA